MLIFTIFQYLSNFQQVNNINTLNLVKKNMFSLHKSRVSKERFFLQNCCLGSLWQLCGMQPWEFMAI